MIEQHMRGNMAKLMPRSHLCFPSEIPNARWSWADTTQSPDGCKNASSSSLMPHHHQQTENHWWLAYALITSSPWLHRWCLKCMFLFHMVFICLWKHQFTLHLFFCLLWIIWRAPRLFSFIEKLNLYCFLLFYVLLNSLTICLSVCLLHSHTL